VAPILGRSRESQRLTKGHRPPRIGCDGHGLAPDKRKRKQPAASPRHPRRKCCSEQNRPARTPFTVSRASPTSAHGEQAATPVGKTVVLRSEATEAPETSRSSAPEPPLPHNEENAPASEQTRGSTRRPFVRWLLFALLPLALIAGGYWYVHGGKSCQPTMPMSRPTSRHLDRCLRDRAGRRCQREPSRSGRDRCSTGSIPASSDCPR